MIQSLLKEFVNQTDLKKSDGSDAGKSDVSGKAPASDVKFSLMRNTINSDGNVSGSDVANYLEKAHDINDEVDTVLYGLETSDGEVVKVYVNATQADAFEVEMKKLLGMEDDIEAAINDLATRFDIVDVIWPKGQGPENKTPPSDELNLDQTVDIGDPDADAEHTEEPAPDHEETSSDGDNMEVIASADDVPPDEDVADADAGPSKKKAGSKKGGTGPDTDDDNEEGTSDDEGDTGDTDADVDAGNEPDEEGGEEGSDDEEGGEKPAKKKPGKKEDKGGKHDKLANLGKNMKTEEGLKDNAMTGSIGSKFLQRVLAEDTINEADRDGVQDGMSIPLDTQQRALAARMKWKLPKQIIQLFAMVGVPGVKLNSAGAEKSIASAAETLRSELSVRRAFMDFFKAYAAMKGYDTSAKPVGREVMEAKIKRGNYLQKQLETVLVHLGMPEELVSTTGSGIVGSALYKASKDIEDAADVKAKLRTLALRLGIKPSDTMAPLEDDDQEQVKEAIDPMGADRYADAVMQFVALMGVPDTAFNRQARMIIAKEFRDERATTNLNALLSLVKRFSTQFAAQKARLTKGQAGPQSTEPTTGTV